MDFWLSVSGLPEDKTPLHSVCCQKQDEWFSVFLIKVLVLPEEGWSLSQFTYIRFCLLIPRHLEPPPGQSPIWRYSHPSACNRPWLVKKTVSWICHIPDWSHWVVPWQLNDFEWGWPRLLREWGLSCSLLRIAGPCVSITMFELQIKPKGQIFEDVLGTPKAVFKSNAMELFLNFLS
jgi:hypothetical protein